MSESSELGREVRRLAVPAILNSLLLTAVIVVDRIMLGHHAESSLAGMQIAGPVEWTVWSLFTAFQVGTLARVGRFVGRGDGPRAGLTAQVSVGLAVVIGVGVALLSPWIVDAALWGAPHASPAVAKAARDYLALTLAFSPAVVVGATAVAILQAAGDTRTPLLIGVVVNVVHIGLNRVLILGAFGVPAMGPRGCGISTSITLVLEALAAITVLLVRAHPVTLRGARPNGPHIHHEARAIAKIGLPSLLERVLYHAGYLGFVAMIALLGDTPMAANQALISIESICFMSGDGFGVAAAALVAQSLGRGESARAERFAARAALYSLVMLTTLGVLAYLLRSPLLRAFSSDPNVLAEGLHTIPVLVLAQPFMAVAIVLGQSLRGAGDTKGALGVSAIGALVVRLTCTWLLAFKLGLGLKGVWLGSTCDWVVRSSLLVLWGRGRLRRAE